MKINISNCEYRTYSATKHGEAIVVFDIEPQNVNEFLDILKEGTVNITPNRKNCSKPSMAQEMHEITLKTKLNGIYNSIKSCAAAGVSKLIIPIDGVGEMVLEIDKELVANGFKTNLVNNFTQLSITW